MAALKYVCLSSSISSFLIIFLSQFVNCHDDGSYSIRYDANSFHENISNNFHFVMFFAPWCGHCKRLAPTWEELAEKYNKQSQLVVSIAKVDCTIDTSLCSEQDVNAYPTLKFFKVGEPSTRYRGKRDLESLDQFVQEQLGTEQVTSIPIEVPKPEYNLVELDDKNFHGHIASGLHFVKFFTPWCRHCIELAPIWKALAESFQYDGSVSISKVDCTVHSNLCDEFNVKGYPTLLWFEDGKQIIEYDGDVDHENLKAFITKMKGDRTKSLDQMDDGRIPDMSVSPVIQLTRDNFKNGISTGTTFVKFYAPWCSHCKRLSPVWDELSKKFLGSIEVRIAKVDCTVEKNKQLCKENEVEGYPSLMLFKNGVKVEEYGGSRDLVALHQFVMRKVNHDEL